MNQLVEFIKNPSSVAGFSEGDWDQLLRYSRYAKMTGQIYSWLQSSGDLARAPKDAIGMLEAESVRAAHMQLRTRREIEELKHALVDSDIPVILLKGAAYICAQLPCATGRRLSDVDILVPRERLAETEAKLRLAGWQTDTLLNAYDDRYYREWSHEIPPLIHSARGIEIDLHHNIVPHTSRIKLNADLLFQQCQPLPDSPFFILAPEDMFLHSATHLFFNDELRGGLRDLVDMYVLSQRFATNPLFWQQLLVRAKELGVERLLYYALSSLMRLFQLEIPEGVYQQVLHYQSNTLIDSVMTKLIDAELAPQNPDKLGQGLAHQLLFIRAKWVSMPPLMLFAHLAYKTRYRIKQRRAHD